MQHLLDALEHHVNTQPNATAFSMANTNEPGLTYAQCQQQAQTVAATLKQRYPAGSRLLLLLDNSLDFIVAFLACWYADTVPVPQAPPNPNRHRLAADLDKLRYVCADCTPAAIITHPLIKTLMMKAAQDQIESLPELITLDTLPNDTTAPILNHSNSELAFIQYTSGSTGHPKGVMISHHNILTNAQVVKDATLSTEAIVTWIPAFHDHGIMSCLFAPLLFGRQSIMLTPLAFLQQPLSWLQAINNAPPCCSTASNFALEWCCDKIKPEDCADLNLSHWHKVSIGAEKNQLATLQRFTRQFANIGVSSGLFSACYGLAEHTLCVSGYAMAMQQAPASLTLDATALAQGRLQPASDNKPSTTLLSHGPAIHNHRILIVNPQSGQVCGEDTLGEIWCQGDSVAGGYWNNPTATQDTFAAQTQCGIGPCLKTGDLGFLHQGELYITGRMKDVLVIHGNNYAAEEIEWLCAKAHPAVRDGSVCAICDERDNQEHNMLLLEVRPDIKPTVHELRQSLQSILASQLGIHLDQLLFFTPNTLSKTTSGKIQRAANKQRLQQQQITPLVRIKHPDQLSLTAPQDRIKLFFQLEDTPK